MANWNGFDFFIFLIFAANTVLGISRGATKEITYMMCLSLGIIFAIKFTVPLTAFFNSSPMMHDMIGNRFVENFMTAIGAPSLTMDLLKQIFFSLSFLIAFFVPYFIISAGLSMAGFSEVFSFPYATLNRKVGAALGCTRGYIYSLILLMILTLHLFMNDSGPMANMYKSSYFANLFRTATVKFDQIIIDQNPDRYREVFGDKALYNADDIIKQLNQTPTQSTDDALSPIKQGMVPQPTQN